MNYKIFIFSVIIILMALLPVFRVYEQAGDQWKGVVPTYTNDDLYYYARMENVVHGYPLIGNPYFFEHRADIGPTSFLPDWIAAAPQFLGLSFIDAVAFNFIFWSLVFSLLLFVLFRKLSVQENAALAGAFFTYSFLYMLMLRPVAMQIVYPFFILFCIAYYLWLEAEKPTIRQSIFLVFTTVVSIYLYSYSWQLALAILGLTGLFYIHQRNWDKFKNLIYICCASFAFALPDIFYTAKQLSNPFFWDTMIRINLVVTRLPTFLSFYDGILVCLMLALWHFCFLWIKKLGTEKKYRSANIFICITGASLIVALFSNVITGKDFEISNHFDRYVLVWLSVMLMTSAYWIWRSRTDFSKIERYKKIIVSVLFLVSFFAYGQLFIEGFGLSGVLHTDTLSMQAYAAPLAWLDTNGIKQAVVWSDGNIGFYLPVETSDFTLFNPAGGLHLVSPAEVEERYLVSHYFDDLTLADIENDYRQYAGVGNAVHASKTFNRKVKICTLLQLSILGVSCGEQTDAVSFKGQHYFVNLHNQYINKIQPNILDELKKFNVAYILKDNQADEAFDPNKLPSTKLSWTDGRFEIYSIQYK